MMITIGISGGIIPVRLGIGMVSVLCCCLVCLLTASSVDGYSCWSGGEGEETRGAREAAGMIFRMVAERIIILDCIDSLTVM